MGKDKLKILSEVNREIHQFIDSGADAVWEKFLEKICSELKCEAGSFFTVDEERRLLTLKIVIGAYASDITNLSFSYEGIAGKCAEKRESIMINDVYNDSAFCKKVDHATGFTTKAVLCVPVIHNVSLLGIIELLNPEKGFFEEQDCELVDFLCTAIAKAVHGQGQV